MAIPCEIYLAKERGGSSWQDRRNQLLGKLVFEQTESRCIV